mmetsp:Transcript_24959/g.69611  ORF Transcript_24959/g.69611 Transcript_24959/m.69611 type:complete len:110 (-) Transcript_24959:683-1012(-)
MGPATAGKWRATLCQHSMIQAYYFLQFSGLACVLPFLNLMFRRAGLSEAMIGVIAAVRPWVSALASTGWATLADTYLLHRPMFLAAFVTSRPPQPPAPACYCCPARRHH